MLRSKYAVFLVFSSFFPRSKFLGDILNFCLKRFLLLRAKLEQ